MCRVRTEFPSEISSPRVAPAALRVSMALAERFAQKSAKHGLRGRNTLSAVRRGVPAGAIVQEILATEEINP